MKATIKGTVTRMIKEGKGKKVISYELKNECAKFYQSRTGWGQMFLTARVSEAVGRLVTAGLVERVCPGVFKWIGNNKKSK